MEKISVIVPVYQAEQYVNRCVDSILTQTHTNLEIILIDDGSTDRSRQICDEYARQDQRVKVIHKKNAGVAAARNAGLDVATGTYLAFVDSDDYIDPDMYEKMMGKAVQYDCDLVMCDCMKEQGESSRLYTHEIRPGFYSYEQLKTEYYPHLIMMENVEYPATISNWLFLFRRQLSSGMQIPRYLEGVRYSEDLLFGAQLMYACRSFYYMKGKAYYHYYMNPTSATHTYAPDKWKDYRKLYLETKAYFEPVENGSFRGQLDLMLLFLAYNGVGNILHDQSVKTKIRVRSAKQILNEPMVKQMFQRLNIRKLPIHTKLRLVTYCYKFRIGIGLLSRRWE